jgi:DNA-directed RNA polymerase subunit beta
VPEAFKLLVKELQSLSINVEILNEDEQKIHVTEDAINEEIPELGVNLSGFERTESY